nr:MAG TPA: hypothetical protein [Caudoviricetes sp.]
MILFYKESNHKPFKILGCRMSYCNLTVNDRELKPGQVMQQKE